MWTINVNYQLERGEGPLSMAVRDCLNYTEVGRLAHCGRHYSLAGILLVAMELSSTLQSLLVVPGCRCDTTSCSKLLQLSDSDETYP